MIYLLQCKVCGKQYVGSPTERLKFRWNNYKDNQLKTKRSEDHTEKHFHEQFLSHDHISLINDIEVIFIGKTNLSNPTRRAKIKTLAPNGLNIEE